MKKRTGRLDRRGPTMPLRAERLENRTLLTHFGPEFPVNSSDAGDEVNSAVASRWDSDGFAAVWQGPSSNGVRVFLQRFDSSGNFIGPQQTIDPDQLGDQLVPDVAVDSAGRIVVTWQTFVDAQRGDDIFMRVVDWDGNFITSTLQVNVTQGEVDANQNNPAVAMSGSGEFVVGWQDKNRAIRARQYSLLPGNRGLGETVNTIEVAPLSDQVTQENPDVAMDADGSMVFVWDYINSADGDDGDGAIFARHFEVDSPLREATRINQTTVGIQQHPTVATARHPFGNFTIAWQGEVFDGSGTSQGFDIFARRFKFDGDPPVSGPADEIRVNTTTSGDQTDPTVAMDGADSFIIAWHGPGNSLDVFAREFDARSGLPDGPDFILAGQSDIQRLPSIAATPDGTYMAAWEGNQSGTFDIYARLTRDPTTQQPDLAVTITDSPDPVSPGGNITYAISLSNNGGAAATGTVLQGTLPSGVSFQSGLGCTGTAQGFRCDVGGLGSSASTSFSVVVSTPQQGGSSIRTTVTATSSEADASPSDNQATATTSVLQSQCQGDLEAELDAGELTVRGDSFRNCVNVRKNGQGVIVIGLRGTTVNGSPSASFQGVDKLNLRMGRGNDDVRIFDLLLDELNIQSQNGDDSIRLQKVNAEAVIDGGAGNDSIRIVNSQLGRSTIKLRNGDDTIITRKLTGTTLRILGGAGDDEVNAKGSKLNRLIANLAAGSDTAHIAKKGIGRIILRSVEQT